MSTPERWEGLQDRIRDYLVSATNVRTALVIWLGPERAARISYLNGPREYIDAVMEVCRAERDALLSLLRFFKHDGALFPWLEELEKNSDLGLPVAVDPWRRFVLKGDLPFVNRHRLRTLGRALQTDSQAAAVLVIRGPEKTGKSYSRQFIAEVADCSGRFTIAHVDLDDEQQLGPADLALAIVRAARRDLAGAEPPPQRNSEKRWIEELVLWTLQHIDCGEHARPVWIVLDNLRLVWSDVESRVRLLKAFLLELATLIGIGGVQLRCKLLLIDFDPTPLEERMIPIAEEQVAGLTSADLLDYLRGVFPDLPEGQREKIANELDPTALPANERLRRLNKSLRELMASLRREAGPSPAAAGAAPAAPAPQGQ